jgi:uncharacterized membrane protein
MTAGFPPLPFSVLRLLASRLAAFMTRMKLKFQNRQALRHRDVSVLELGNDDRKTE